MHLQNGFALSTYCDDAEIAHELDSGRLIHHSTIGNIEVYRATESCGGVYVDDYFPTVMALARGSAPEPGESPAFVLCYTSALWVRDCGVLLPQSVYVMVQPDRISEIDTDVEGSTVLPAEFTDDEWTWEWGMPVLNAVNAIGELAANPGMEPTWLVSALEDAYDSGQADIDALVAAVDARARSWGYLDGHDLVRRMSVGLI